MAHVRLLWHDGLPAGCCDHDEQTVSLSRDMLQHQRRAVLAHELAHLERGPVPGWATLREEAAVDQAAARALIPLAALADALRWSENLWEMSQQLWVDVHTLQVRLNHLHPSEKHYLRRVVAAKGNDD
jgi:hypothetical protein